ncbi:MAG: peptide chain release factor N(5)-glutamine methyltransferase [Bacteroidales bacterium]|nr:peptide chain release factor N(5)-glutamine methyltransferase [Bacteroidales bacterium]
MLLTEFIRESTASLEALYPTKEARTIVLMLCEAILGTKSYTHIVEPECQVDKKKMPKLKESLQRLEQGEPIQYVIGTAEFCDYTFNVNPAVLIPRPETEMLVREAIKIASRIRRMRIPYGKNATPVRILDLCTGSGCIAWLLALSVPGCQVTAVDNSEVALKVARTQPFAQKLKELQAIAPTFVNADILDTEQDFKYGPFDLILSNPPYIMESEKPSLRKNVVDYEPATALYVPDEDPLLYYRAIARWSERFLTAEGKCLTEINSLLGRETEALFRNMGFRQTEKVRDFYDKTRFIFYSK